jgi:colanic acid/amylovoran biosynthesis glycosyltransferase
MSARLDAGPRVGYVLKRYPRYSETFVVNEILAHEAAGLELEIFALRPSCDTHFQDIIARVRSPVRYLPSWSLPTWGASDLNLWALLREAGAELPDLWPTLEVAKDEEVREVYQAVTLAREARQRGIQHLHAHFATSATAVARLAARFAGISYSCTVHAKDIFHASVRADDLRRKLADAATVVTISDYNLHFLREQHGAAAARVTRIYNGLNLPQFPYAAPQDRAPRIVAVGRLIEKKGFADLIAACALLADRGRRFECQIVGGGELQAALQAQIDRLGLCEQVQLTGPRPQREVIQLVQSAAAFAAPCVVGGDNNQDGLPTVLLEAMALGTPCAATDVTGIPEVLRDEQTGLSVPQHDPVRLAAALERLLSDAELRVRLAHQARRLIEWEFDIHRNTARLREVFMAGARRGLDAPREIA